VTTLFALVRALHFAGLMAIFGAAALAFLAREPRNDPRLRRPLGIAALVALATAILSLCLTTGEMTGVPEASYDIFSVTTVVAQTFYGNVFMVRIALLIGLCLLCVADTGPGLKALTAGLALALLGLTSHAAAAGDARYEYVRAAVDALHLLAAGFWIGGLVALLPPIFTRPGDVPKLVAKLRLFSFYGLIAVAILVVAGTLNGVAILDVRGMQWSGTYLTWLAVKLVLAGVMIALALTNRFGVLPALARGETEARDTIPLTVLAELGCAGLILLAVGFLGLTSPMQM
jgi:putative copper resistance protein D